MSSPIEAQTDILSEISAFLYASAPGDFEEVNCILDYFVEEDGSWSVDSEFSYMLSGVKVGAYLNDPNYRVPALVAELHKAM